MSQNDKIQLFEDKRIRTAWDEEKEEWYFSVVDVVAVLTDQPDARHAPAGGQQEGHGEDQEETPQQGGDMGRQGPLHRGEIH